jgi:putative endonuclease
MGRLTSQELSPQDQSSQAQQLSQTPGLPKPWFLYILQSTITGKLYTGISTDPDRRLILHNAGKGAKFTRAGRPWIIVYREQVGSKSEALRRELAVKKLSRSEKLSLRPSLP